MTRRTMIVLGGALAGPTAAARARELDEHARIILVERSRSVSYAQCGLAYYLSGEVQSLADLNRERAEFFESVYGIEVLTETEAVALDPKRHSVLLRSRRGDESVSYDKLIFALGAASRFPESLPPAQNVVSFRTLDDLAEIERRLASPNCRVTVIGGGPFGLEAADGLTRRGAKVTLVEASPRLLNKFSATFSLDAERNLRSHATVHTGATVTSAESRHDAVTRIRLTNGTEIDTDLIISAIGVEPRTGLARDAGLELTSQGAIVIDDMARTSAPDVFACGVCVAVPDLVTATRIWSPQGALADKTAQVAGGNAVDGHFKISPTSTSLLVRLADRTYGRCGLSWSERKGRRTLVVAPAVEPYMAQACSMLVELIWDEETGCVLGVECAAALGVDKRIDVVATAIAGGITIDRLATLDFAYEPPSNAARDPINVAAMVAMQERQGLGRSVFPEELDRWRDAQMIDVRDANGSRIPNARTIPLTILREKLSELDASRPVITVSQTGRRGWIASRILRQHGFKEVMNLAGGMQTWRLFQPSS